MRIISFLSGLFVADMQYNRAVGIVSRLRARAVGRAKSVNAGSLRVGDALKRYGDSRRPGVVQLSPRPRGLGGRGTGCNHYEGRAEQYDWKSDMAAIGARSTMAR